MICTTPHSAALDNYSGKLAEELGNDVELMHAAVESVTAEIRKFGVGPWCRATTATVLKTIETISRKYSE
jgi:hypothetical protein